MSDDVKPSSRAAGVSVLLMLLLLLQAVGVLEVLGAVESGWLLEIIVEHLNVVLLHHFPYRDVKHEEGATLSAWGFLDCAVGRMEHPHLQHNAQDSDLVNHLKCRVSLTNFSKVRHTVMIASHTQEVTSMCNGRGGILHQTQADITRGLEVTLLERYAHDALCRMRLRTLCV